VNLAIQMYRDASKGLYERIILVSNDSDAEPALEAIREDFPNIVIGVVAPIRHRSAGIPAHRQASGSLARQAHWIITDVSDGQLHAAQLPAHVPTNKKPIRKPPQW
jgi:hypothetical protein